MRIVKTTFLLLLLGGFIFTSCTKEEEETLPFACTEKIRNLENFLDSRQTAWVRVINETGIVFEGQFKIENNLLKVRLEDNAGFPVVFDLCEMTGYKEIGGGLVNIYL